MHPPRKASGQTLQLLPVTTDLAPVLRNLFELYLHDFSESLGFNVDERGHFLSEKAWQATISPPHEQLPRWLARVSPDGQSSGAWAGFAIVAHQSWLSGEAGVHDIDEFFIMRAYRRRGHGNAMARAIIAQFPGAWEVRVRRENSDALSFWRKAIAAITGGVFMETMVESTRWQGPVLTFRMHEISRNPSQTLANR